MATTVVALSFDTVALSCGSRCICGPVWWPHWPLTMWTCPGTHSDCLYGGLALQHGGHICCGPWCNPALWQMVAMSAVSLPRCFTSSYVALRVALPPWLLLSVTCVHNHIRCVPIMFCLWPHFWSPASVITCPPLPWATFYVVKGSPSVAHGFTVATEWCSCGPRGDHILGGLVSLSA